MKASRSWAPPAREPAIEDQRLGLGAAKQAPRAQGVHRDLHRRLKSVRLAFLPVVFAAACSGCSSRSSPPGGRSSQRARRDLVRIARVRAGRWISRAVPMPGCDKLLRTVPPPNSRGEPVGVGAPARGHRGAGGRRSSSISPRSCRCPTGRWSQSWLGRPRRSARRCGIRPRTCWHAGRGDLWPGNRYAIGPSIDGRLLLRPRTTGSGLRDRPAEDRWIACASSSTPNQAVRAREGLRAPSAARAVRRTSPTSARSSNRVGGGRGPRRRHGHRCYRNEAGRTCASVLTCSSTGTSEGVQADGSRARTGAVTRRSRAHPDLRDARGPRRRNCARTCTDSEEAEKRDHRSSGRELRPVSVPRGARPGSGRVASRGRDLPQAS